MLAVLSSCAEPTPPAPPTNPTPRESQIANEVHQAINQYRISQQLPPLKRHRGLDQLARGHSQYLAKNQGTFSLHGKNVSHFRFDWRAKEAAAKYAFPQLAENVASMLTKPTNQGQNLMILWVASDGHRKNIHGDWTQTGIGIEVTPDDYIIATQLFATKEFKTH